LIAENQAAILASKPDVTDKEVKLNAKLVATIPNVVSLGYTDKAQNSKKKTKNAKLPSMK
jgi:hypothetical protein